MHPDGVDNTLEYEGADYVKDPYGNHYLIELYIPGILDVVLGFISLQTTDDPYFYDI